MTPAEGRKFGLLVGAAFLGVAGFLYWRGKETAPVVLGGLGGLLVLAGAVIPGRLGPVYRAWMGLAHLLSKVTTPIFMGIMYFVVITPMGVLRRAFGGSPLEAKVDDGGVWARRTDGHGSMTRQF
ncbi:MAG: SxtJ family membrane protein [Gemmatimonadales bacterium]